MRGGSLTVFILVISLLGACTATPEDLTGIDWDIWNDDRNGCLRKRAEYLSSLEEQLEKLKSRSEMDIVDLMGRPDATELLKRNQKSFTYFITASPDCEKADSTSKKLIIRFNAMGLAKEVAID